VIRGWEEGLLRLTLGEKARLHISSDLAYGPRGLGSIIPPNSDLMFDVELLQIGEKKAPARDAKALYEKLKRELEEKERKAREAQQEEEEGRKVDADGFAIPAGRGVKRKADQMLSDVIEDEELDELLALAGAEAAAAEVEELDEKQLRVLVHRLEKAISENVKMRNKFPDKPEKFMDSEVELDAAIQALRPLATSSELYPLFVELKAVPSLLSLLTHENIDVAISVTRLLFELTEPDEEEEPEDVLALTEELLRNKALHLLVDNLPRYNEEETEDATAVHNTMAIVEHLVEVKEEVAKVVSKETKLIPWLLERLQKPKLDANTFYAAELLDILLQAGGPEVRVSQGEAAVEALVKAVARYRKGRPRRSRRGGVRGESMELSLLPDDRQPREPTRLWEDGGG